MKSPAGNRNLDGHEVPSGCGPNALRKRSRKALIRHTGAVLVGRMPSTQRHDMRQFHEAIRDGLTGMYRSPYETLAPASSEHDLIEAVVRAEATNVANTLNRQTPESIRALRTLLIEASSIAIIGGRFSHALAVYLHAHLRLIRSGAVILRTADVADDIAHLGRGSLIVIFDFRRYHPQAEFAARYVKARRGKVVVITDPHLSPAAHHADHTLVAEIEGPHLVESYASVVALLDMIIGDLVATNGDAMRRRIGRVESAREQLDELMQATWDDGVGP